LNFIRFSCTTSYSFSCTRYFCPTSDILLIGLGFTDNNKRRDGYNGQNDHWDDLNKSPPARLDSAKRVGGQALISCGNFAFTQFFGCAISFPNPKADARALPYILITMRVVKYICQGVDNK